jgi:hypothetical protein
MDSPVALALMAKAQAVFGSENFFLSFPVVPQPFTKEKLSFIAGGTVSAESLTGIAEFTRLVNLEPGKPVWLPTGDTYLWDAYGDVLKSAQLALSIRTAEEEVSYQAALKYLHIVHVDGTWEDTPQVKVYKQYRDASLALQQDYNNRKISADLSTDPAIKQKWQNVDEPALKAQIQKLLNDWTTDGYKAQIEDAESTFARLGAKSSQQTWEQWQSQLNPQIDTFTDTSGQSVFITGFSPSDILDEPTWQRFTLSGDEVATLVSQAPDELKKRLAPDAVNLDIDMLSLEYTSVYLTRPWLQPGVFDARFWRFNDGTPPLSDGKTQPSGRFPAYVVSVVFARNIEVRLKAQSSTNTAAVPHLKKGVSFGVFKLSPSPVLTDALKQPVFHTDPPPPEVEPTGVETTIPTGVKTTIPTGVETTIPTGVETTITAANFSSAEIENEISSALLTQSDRVSTVLKSSDYLRFPPTQWGQPPPTPSTDVLDNSIYIMTFICKALPLCPNPDLTLQW